MERDGPALGAAILVTAMLVLAGPPAHAAPAPGDPAPGFRLPDLARERIVSSDTLLAPAGAELLLFWNTACPECLAATLATSTRLAACDSLAVIGIVAGEERIGDARRFARDSGLRFLNLWDGTGHAAAAYGASGESYAAFLVSAAGKVLLAQVGRPDPLSDFLDAVCARAREPDSARTR